MPFDARTAVRCVNPKRHDVVRSTRATAGGFLEHRLPVVDRAVLQARCAMRQSDVLTHCVPLEAVHAALALLQIDGVRRQVPVHDRVAVVVKVEPLLPHGRRRYDEGPKRRVEGLAHRVSARRHVAIV
jgi:hypothetical protein